VLGIVAVLATIAVPALVGARARARDQARVTDLNTIYRFLGTAGGTSVATYWPTGIPDEGDLKTLTDALAAKYGGSLFAQAPTDPRAGSGATSGYRYRYDNGDVAIYANLENPNAPPTLSVSEPTPAGGRGVLVGTGTWASGVNGTDRYYQVSN
jgi:type II secretory pathway pseudopilin PulG